MPNSKLYSIGKAFAEIVQRGALTGVERETHLALDREAEPDLNEFKWMRDLAQLVSPAHWRTVSIGAIIRFSQPQASQIARRGGDLG
jgi:hypothetical protein